MWCKITLYYVILDYKPHRKKTQTWFGEVAEKAEESFSRFQDSENRQIVNPMKTNFTVSFQNMIQKKNFQKNWIAEKAVGYHYHITSTWILLCTIYNVFIIGRYRRTFCKLSSLVTKRTTSNDGVRMFFINNYNTLFINQDPHCNLYDSSCEVHKNFPYEIFLKFSIKWGLALVPVIWPLAFSYF